MPAAPRRRLRLSGPHQRDAERRGPLLRKGTDGWTNKNFLWLLVEDYGLDKPRRQVKRPLEGLRVGPFYGCYVLRPKTRLGYDEHPDRDLYLEHVIETLGGQVVDYDGARSAAASRSSR